MIFFEEKKKYQNQNQNQKGASFPENTAFSGVVLESPKVLEVKMGLCGRPRHTGSGQVRRLGRLLCMHPRWKLVYCTYAVSIEQGTYDCGSEGLSSLHHGEVVKKKRTSS